MPFRSLSRIRPTGNWERIRLNFLSNAFRIIRFGGSKVIGVDDGASLTVEFIDQQCTALDGTLLDGLLARFRVETKNEAGGSCTPQLFNLTTNEVAGQGVTDSGTSAFSRQDFPVTLAPGVNFYQARLVRSSAVLNAWAIGYLELTPSTREADED